MVRDINKRAILPLVGTPVTAGKTIGSVGAGIVKSDLPVTIEPGNLPGDSLVVSPSCGVSSDRAVADLRYGSRSSKRDPLCCTYKYYVKSASHDGDR